MADHALGNSLQTYLTLQIRDISNQDSLNSDLLTSIIPTAYSDVIFTSSPCFTAGPNEYQWLLESSGKFSIKTTIGLFQSPPTSPLSYYLIWDPFLPDKFSLLCCSLYWFISDSLVYFALPSGLSLPLMGALERPPHPSFQSHPGNCVLVPLEVLRDGTSRFTDVNGEIINHFLWISSFGEYTVVDVVSLTKFDPNTIPPNRACLLSCGVSTGVASVGAGSGVVIFGFGSIGLAV
ncbi:hypothetical protein M9H77_17033 [Catharanthus roseus]|uniref:Uncharacterized protein n=1 Tax=Catharanthus roseus TaxID=4058 RepID=A0ACC0B3F0_CATRO|nr:hypothetical protein M9H77_17033 [Catharanthus roseus]